MLAKIRLNRPWLRINTLKYKSIYNELDSGFMKILQQTPHPHVQQTGGRGGAKLHVNLASELCQLL